MTYNEEWRLNARDRDEIENENEVKENINDFNVDKSLNLVTSHLELRNLLNNYNLFFKEQKDYWVGWDTTLIDNLTGLGYCNDLLSEDDNDILVMILDRLERNLFEVCKAKQKEYLKQNL